MLEGTPSRQFSTASGIPPVYVHIAIIILVIVAGPA